jgi:sugar transferase (PEP-CTERM/EpsH1 system associated)
LKIVKRLLYIAHRVPYPPDKGERVRAFHEIKALSQHFRITLATLTHSEKDRQAAQYLRQWCKRVILARAGGKWGLVRGIWTMATGRSVTEGYFHSRSLVRQLKKVCRQKEFHLAMGYSSSTLEYLLSAPVSHRVMDFIDVDSAKWFSYAEEARWPKSWLYYRESRAVRQLEQDAIVNCDTVLVVSEAESEELSAYSKKIGVLSNGVDTDYFVPNTGYQSDEVSLVFTGTMDYRPNIEGVCWFVREVWPELKRQKPELSFYIVGRDPSRAVKGLANCPGVNVTGSVPDVRPYLSRARVAVCPLNIARGIQNKVLEAMAMGKAVVASKPALEGLELEVGREVLQADSVQQWQQTIVKLLSQDTLREGLEIQARQCVEERYSWSARMAPLVELCHKLCAEPEVITVAGRSSKEQPVLMEEERVSQGNLRAAPANREGQKPTKKWRWPSNWKEKALWLITLAYVIFLIVVNLTPAEDDKEEWLDSISSGMQNFLHVPAYSILMILVTLAMITSMRNRLVGLILSALCCFGFGVFMEYTQGLVPGRVVHMSDMLRNGAGIMIVLPILFFWLWRPPSRYDK